MYEVVVINSAGEHEKLEHVTYAVVGLNGVLEVLVNDPSRQQTIPPTNLLVTYGPGFWVSMSQSRVIDDFDNTYASSAAEADGNSERTVTFEFEQGT